MGSSPAMMDMEYGRIIKFEFLKKALVLLLFVVSVVALHMSCLFSSNGCFFCMVNQGRKMVFDVNAATASDGDGAFNIADIRTFSKLTTNLKTAATRTDTLPGKASTALRSLYNSKVHGDEHLVPSNLKLKMLWTSKDWRIKVSIFTDAFSELMKKDVLKPCFKTLCIGAGQGHEVLALKEMGIYNSIGVDLVAFPPLVLKGDIHSLPFSRDTFDFEFCNVFDHALFSSAFAAEIERTLKPGGCVAIHLMLKNRTQEAYTSNDLPNVGVLIALFRNFEALHVGEINAFGLDTEVILRKPLLPKKVGVPN